MCDCDVTRKWRKKILMESHMSIIWRDVNWAPCYLNSSVQNANDKNTEIALWTCKSNCARIWRTIASEVQICSVPEPKLLNGFRQNLTGSKYSTSSTKIVFFRADQKNKMAALALLNLWMECDETLQEAITHWYCPLTILCTLGRSITKKTALADP